MTNNTKLELAKEIMSRMIAKKCLNNFDSNDKELILLLKENEEMYQFNTKTINKIINVYGAKLKGNAKQL